MLLKQCTLANLSSRSSILGSGYFAGLIYLFRAIESMHILSVPFFLSKKDGGSIGRGTILDLALTEALIQLFPNLSRFNR